MTCPRIGHTLIIGTADGMEAAAGAAAAVSKQVTSLPAVGGIELAAGSLAPDLIVVCQHWPEEYSSTEVDRLMASFPLARLVCCYGPWCASDGRTRTLWPAATRVAVLHAPERIRKERDVIAGRRPPLPLTAGLDEIFAFDRD